jgi:pSer/pThr/pTyr-binding forkhead associated (FHA) protein
MSSPSVEELLLALKVAFLVLLYLFIWRIVRTASRDVRLPQESFILSPGAAGRRGDNQTGRLVVVRSPSLSPGREEMLDSAPLSIGRGGDNDLELVDDGYASIRHARFQPRRDGVWVEDVGSTNGTFVNGVRLSRPRKLAAGDLVRVGETDLRFEA